MASTGDSLGALGLLGFRTSGKRSSRAAPTAPPAHPHPPALVAASSAGGASAGSTAAAPAAPVEARVVISVVGGPRVAAADYEPGPDESVGAKLLRFPLVRKPRRPRAPRESPVDAMRAMLLGLGRPPQVTCFMRSTYVYHTYRVTDYSL